MSRRSIISTAIGLALAASSLLVAPASAAPTLGVEISRVSKLGTSLTTIARNDEFASYRVKVNNTGLDPTAGTVSLFLSFPAGVRPVAASGTNWSCELDALVCSYTAAIPTGGSSATLTLSQVWLEPAAPASVTFTATAAGAGAAKAAVAKDSFSFGPPTPFGLEVTEALAEEEAGGEMTQAGGHPFAAWARFKSNQRTRADGIHIPVEDLHSGVSEIPPGVIGNPSAAEAVCSAARLKADACPAAAAVGGVFVDLAGPEQPGGAKFSVAVYRMAHESGYPASFGFKTPATSFIVRAKVRSDGDYGITAVIPLVPSSPPLYESLFTFCGYGAKITAGFEGCRKPSEPVHNAKPFISLGTDCAAGAPLTRFAVDSWIHRGALGPDGLPDLSDPNWVTRDFFTSPLSGCQALSEAWTGAQKPSFTFQSDSHQADSPAAYTAHLHIPQDGLDAPNGLATAHLKDTTVTLPAGLSFNPGIGDGLAACSESQIGLIGTGFPAPNRVRFDTRLPSCPPNSKVGVATIQTPLLEESLHGSVYLAAQQANPFGSDYAIYLAVEESEIGVVLKLAGKVVPDPVTGRIVTTFADNPQLPFTDLDLSFFGGPRAALANPVTCGDFALSTAFTPWSAADPEAPKADEIATPGDTISIDSGPGSSSCPASAAARPFDIGFSAGSRNPRAGAHSPFSIRITRPDGSQELQGLEIAPPPGFLASLRGIPYCSEAQIAAARARSGRAEQASPSCPAASRVGSTNAGAGPGSAPFYAAGALYLAGPYKGAPLSVVAITPAVAGPFDLGNVVIRSALRINPTSARITAVTDQIPAIVRGIPLRIRDVQIDLDRDNWTQNPTGCQAMAVDLAAYGDSGAISRPSNRFQADDCGSLGFAPKLRARLQGANKRGGYPAFTATLTYPEGAYSNIASTSVALPHSAFLAQEHIRTVCTRAQFAASQCPASSVYGHAEASTPLLDQPLTGNVYLRTSSNRLPDLVIALRGPASQPIAVDLVGRVDSVHGGIRTTFETVPDAPVSQFTLHMAGGRRGLLLNSRDLCRRGAGRMTVRMLAHNGKRADQFPRLRGSCPKKR
jgi:hypothetical protein